MNLFLTVFAEGAAQQAPEGIPTAGLIQSLAFPVLLIAVFYFMIIRPQRKGINKQKKCSPD